MRNKKVKTKYRQFFNLRSQTVSSRLNTSALQSEQILATLKFELNNNEMNELVANCDRLSGLKHSSVLPIVFTEQGVAMLSSVLRSEQAIKINIEIMRAFARYSSILNENESLKKEITDLDKKLDTVFRFLLHKIDALHQAKNKPGNPLGFKIKISDSSNEQSK